MNEAITNRLKQILAQPNTAEGTCNDAASKEPVDEAKCAKEKEACIELLTRIIDGQASEAEQDTFLEHTKECSPCFKKYKLQATIKEVLLQKIEKKSLPCDLIDCIKSKIKETQL